jgi:MFS family permease
MITWGVLDVAMMFVKTPAQFYAVRFLLGVAEAGFFPGVIYPIIWLLTVPYFAYYAMGFGYVAWAPTLIKGVLGTQNTVTTLVSAAVALVSVAADISSGLYSDRTRDRCALALAGLAVASVRRTDRPHQRDWINGWLFWTLYHRIRERSDWQ